VIGSGFYHRTAEFFKMPTTAGVSDSAIERRIGTTRSGIAASKKLNAEATEVDTGDAEKTPF
jgi:hypothetical protein